MALLSGESALSECPATAPEIDRSERSISEFSSMETGVEGSSSDPGTLEESFERERPIVRGGYTNVPCFAMTSSLSAVKARLTTIRSLAGDDDIDGGWELGGLGVFGAEGIWKAGKRNGSCGGVESSSKRRRNDDGRVDG